MIISGSCLLMVKSSCWCICQLVHGGRHKCSVLKGCYTRGRDQQSSTDTSCKQQTQKSLTMLTSDADAFRPLRLCRCRPSPE